MYDDEDFHNILPHLIYVTEAALALRTASVAGPASSLTGLAQQIMDTAIVFAAAVGTADTFEELAAAYQTHYGSLRRQFAQLAQLPIPPAAQAAYETLHATWTDHARREILYHCDFMALDADDDPTLDSGPAADLPGLL